MKNAPCGTEEIEEHTRQPKRVEKLLSSQARVEEHSPRADSELRSAPSPLVTESNGALRLSGALFNHSVCSSIFRGVLQFGGEGAFLLFGKDGVVLQLRLAFSTRSSTVLQFAPEHYSTSAGVLQLFFNRSSTVLEFWPEPELENG